MIKILSGISHFMTGTVRFSAQGDASRLFNLASRNGISLWGFSREGDMFFACCRPGEYKKLAAVKRRCGVKMAAKEKTGLPFLLHRFAKRKGMVIGSFSAIALYMFLSSFVWSVSVSGNESINAKDLLAAAEKSGIYVGASKSSFRPKGSTYEIMGEVDGISWMSVNTDGCFVEIAVKEQIISPEIADDSVPSNMIAEREGKIVSVEAHHGRPEVKPGDTVEAGQLLISGIYSPEIDPYSPQPPEIPVTVGAARGSVKAETYREFTLQISSEASFYGDIENQKKIRALSVFGVDIPLSFDEQPVDGCLQAYEENFFSPLGIRLPLGIKTLVYNEYDKKVAELSEEQQKQAALLKLREIQKSVLPEGSTVLKEDIDYAFSQGVCILSAKCRCIEEIGVIREIHIENKGSE